MNSPGQFLEDYEKLCARMDWAVLGMGKGNDNAQSKLVLEEFREFDRKWGAQIRDAEINETMALVRKQMETVYWKLESIFHEHLLKVIGARSEWWVAEQIFQCTLLAIKLRNEMPEQLRAGFEETLRDKKTGESFDSEKEFRETEQDIVEKESAYRKVLAGFEIDWPERMDAALRERLEKSEDNYKEWEEEVAAQIAKLAPKIVGVTGKP